MEFDSCSYLVKQTILEDLDMSIQESDVGMVTANVSTNTVDRDSEVVLARGMDLEEYQKNPRVLWAHDQRALPVAKTVKIKAFDTTVSAKMKFADHPFAQDVFKLLRDKFLGAFSIGFRLKNATPPEPDEIKLNPDWIRARLIIRNSKLLEFSVVNVPANQDALVVAVSKGMKLADESYAPLGLTRPVKTFSFPEGKARIVKVVDGVLIPRDMSKIKVLDLSA